MKILVIVIVSLVLCITVVVRAQKQDPFLPGPIYTCLKDPTIKQKVEIRAQQSPFYLRGDFDGDGSPDYAVAIRGR